MKYPLALRLLTLLAINFAVVVVFFVLLPGRGGVGWDLLLTTPVRERLLAVADDIARPLSALPSSQWPSSLASFSAAQGVQFSTRDGFDEAHPPPPPDHLPPPEHDGPAPEHGVPPPGEGRGPPQINRSILADMITVQRLGWQGGFALRVPMRVNGEPVDLQVRAAGYIALLRFLGIADWALFALLCLIATALIWIPFAWRLTRAITALHGATQTIAQGRFDVRVPVTRHDELGQLAASVNDMAARLERQVEAQKQFVADVAHEVTAPLARLRVGLELLGPAADSRAGQVQADLQEDAEQMSVLLDELLLFSRTGQAVAHEPAQPCRLSTLVQDALQQEASSDGMTASILVEVPDALSVQVPAALVRRALANLIRNALRYGQTAIEIHAAVIDNQAQITIGDRGPGVPEAALARLGEPFYRPDFARNRAHGGTGLGLAIVRRCVSAAQGGVVFRNRVGGGFEATVTLPLA